MMTGRETDRSSWLKALAPWMAAALISLGPLTSAREEASALAGEQTAERARRLRTEKSLRNLEALAARVEKFTGAPTAAGEPLSAAALRRRGVDALRGLSLAPATLSTGASLGGGISIAGEGSLGTALELLARLGDPGRGSFLRSFVLRGEGRDLSVTAEAGVLPLAQGLTPPRLALPRDPFAFGSARPSAPRAATSREPSRPAPTPEIVTPAVATPTGPVVPFTLQGIVRRGATVEAAILLGGVVRLIKPGDRISGWTCESIDADLGVVFSSATGGRVRLRPTGETSLQPADS